MSTLIVNKIQPVSGTTLETPANTLKISGSASGDLAIEMDQNTGTAANFQIVAPASTERVDFHYNKDLGNTAVMSFASQKVGINNISPAHALDVAGSAQVSSNLTVGGDLTVNGTMTTINKQFLGQIQLTLGNITKGSISPPVKWLSVLQRHQQATLRSKDQPET